jgi:hypothetical protein
VSYSSRSKMGFLPLVLLGTFLGAAGCAGPQVYVPLEQPSQLSAVARWQALQDLAGREQWKVVQVDQQARTMIAYHNPSGVPGVRDRIGIVVLADRTVVETRTEIEDQGLWQASAGHCSKYSFIREKMLATQIEGNRWTAANPTVSLKSTCSIGRAK